MSDDLDVIHAALVNEGYYLAPSLRSQFSAEQLSSLKSGLADTAGPTYVIAYALRDNDLYNGNGADLVARLHDAYPQPGIYLTTTIDLTRSEYSSIRLDARQYDVPGQPDGDLYDYQLLSTVGYENPPDLGTAFGRAVELLNAGPEAVAKAHDKAYATYQDQQDQQDQQDGGYSGSTGSSDGSGTDTGGGFDPTGLVVAVLVLAVLGVLGRAAIRQLGGRRSARRTPVVLPAAALARIRESQERKRLDEAGDAVLALGVGVDEIDLTSANKRVGWQAAFDHFQAARSLLESTLADPEPEPLDVVGVLVLAARGQEALGEARRGRSWTPSTPCFLNPLHGVARERVRLDGGPRGQDVPACVACRTTLAADGVPDMLDVEWRGRVRHYFETDVEPWAATGYGSLDTDLLQALGRARS